LSAEATQLANLLASQIGNMDEAQIKVLVAQLRPGGETD
jgi:hypothetical protein